MRGGGLGEIYWDWVVVVGGLLRCGGMNPLRLASLDASPFCDAKGGGMASEPGSRIGVRDKLEGF